MGIEWMIAWRYLRARKKEGFISIIALLSLLGIMLGVATLIIVMAVMNGFRHELMGRIVGVNGHITLYANNADSIAGYEALLQELQAMEGVISASPLVEGQAMITTKDQALGAVVRGMRLQDIQARKAIGDHMVAGDIAAFAEGGVIAIGERLAKKLRVGVGDSLTLISPQGRASAIGTLPRIKTYEIAALFDVGMVEYDSGMVLMPLADAQKFSRLGDNVSAVEVIAADMQAAPLLAREMFHQFGGKYRVYDWQKANAQFFNALKVERNVMFLILTLIIIVAAFNIWSSMVMLVGDKRRDIAVLRTMGASKGMVMRVFMLCGSSIGVVGTALGFLLGLGFSLNIDAIKGWLESLTNTELFAAEIYFLSVLPAKVEAHEVLQVVVISLLFSFLFTIPPAWKAARQQPAEVLRYE